MNLQNFLKHHQLSVAGPTGSCLAKIFPDKSGFISATATAATSALNLPRSLARKRNWRFRLLFSIVSRSVTWMIPLGPEPTPIKLQFFNISHPIAPDPTRNCRWFTIFSWKVLPNTAICLSYLEPMGWQSSSVGRVLGRDSKESKYMCWKFGWNLAEQALRTSCATKPPSTAFIGAKSPVAW